MKPGDGGGKGVSMVTILMALVVAVVVLVMVDIGGGFSPLVTHSPPTSRVAMSQPTYGQG